MDRQQLLNEYENLMEIGQGSFAKVYKVRHLQLNYIRAIRVLNAMVTGKDDKAFQAFLNECKTLLQLGNGGHPNIVRIYQPRELHNHALVEMDYIDGSDLDDYLKEQKNFIPAGEVMRFASEIGGALAYCHVDCFEFLYDRNKTYEYQLESPLKGKTFRIEPDPENGKKDLITELQRRELIREYGITHNDLHSKNIMRKKYDGSYILLDFGLAIQDGKAVKSSSRKDGAIEYKAPEKGSKDGVVDERSDVYGFGILLYEMLAGRVPFPYDRDRYSGDVEAMYALSLDHENTPPPAIEPLRRAAFEAANPGETYTKDYPDWLEQMIFKCLAKKPGERYGNAKELVVELKRRIAETEATDNEAIEKLKSQNTTLNHDLGALEQEKADLSAQISALTRQFAKASFDADNAEITRLQDQVKALENRCADVATNEATANSEIVRLQDEIKVLEGRCAAGAASDASGKAEIARLQNEIKALENWCATAATKDTAARAQEATLREREATISQQKTKLEALTNDKSKLEKTIETLQGSKPKPNRVWMVACMLFAVATMFLTTRVVTGYNKEDSSDLQYKIALLQDDKARLQNRLDTATTLNEKLTERVKSFNSNNSSSTNQQATINQLTTENEQLKAANKQLEADKSRLSSNQSSSGSSQAEAQLRRDLSSAQTRAQNWEAKYNKKVSELKAVQNELNTVRGVL